MIQYLLIIILLVTAQIEVSPSNGENPAIMRTEQTSSILTKSVAETWELSGPYEQVLSDNPPIYVKDGNSYQIYCLDKNRFTGKDLAAWMTIEKGKMHDKGLLVSHKVTADPKGWLADNGYKAVEVPE